MARSRRSSGDRVVATSRQRVALTTTVGRVDRAEHDANDHRDAASLTQCVAAAQRIDAVALLDERLQTGHRLTR